MLFGGKLVSMVKGLLLGRIETPQCIGAFSLDTPDIDNRVKTEGNLHLHTQVPKKYDRCHRLHKYRSGIALFAPKFSKGAVLFDTVI